MAALRQHVGSVSSAEMRTKANKFLASKKKLNTLVEILETFEIQNDSYIPSLLAIELIFTELLKQGDMYKEIIPLKPEGNTKGDGHRDALRGMYEVSFRQAVRCMSVGAPASRVQALTSAMSLLRAQGRHPTEQQEAGQYYFPVQMLQAIITELLSNDNNNTQLISRFQEYSAYNDVVFNSWKILRNLTPRATPSETYMKNYFELADKLGLKKDSKTKGKQNQEEVVVAPKNLCEAEGKPIFHFQLLKVQRWMARCWSCISVWQLAGDCHRRALLLLLDRLLPNLPNPLLLTDFLMDSMDSGGAASMLALQGVFTLIQQHNLEYPRVYTKLYSMFEPEIFHTKHKSRLFYLADMFLSSTHLPEALVAGFVKRLCRLALIAPPCDVVVLLHFVANLLVRHPALKRMACREEGTQLRQAASSDPYMMEECDPCLSGALQSSVWEACGLRRHAVPCVAEAAARVLAAPHATMEVPIAELLDDTDQDLFDREMKKTYKQVFLTFSRPQSMTLPAGERLTQLWQLV